MSYDRSEWKFFLRTDMNRFRAGQPVDPALVRNYLINNAMVCYAGHTQYRVSTVFDPEPLSASTLPEVGSGSLLQTFGPFPIQYGIDGRPMPLLVEMQTQATGSGQLITASLRMSLRRYGEPSRPFGAGDDATEINVSAFGANKVWVSSSLRFKIRDSGPKPLAVRSTGSIENPDSAFPSCLAQLDVYWLRTSSSCHNLHVYSVTARELAYDEGIDFLNYNPFSASSATLVGWWIPESFVTSSGMITQWDDISGNDYHLTASGDIVHMPDWKEGYSAAYLGGSGSFLAAYAGLLAIGQTPDVTIVAVYESINVGNVASVGWRQGLSSVNDDYRELLIGTGSNHRYHIARVIPFDPESSDSDFLNFGTHAAQQDFVAMSVSSSTTLHWMDGTDNAQVFSGGIDNVLSPTLTGFYVGANSTAFQDWYIAELIVLSGAMPTSEFSDLVNRYLIPKYSLTGNL